MWQMSKQYNLSSICGKPYQHETRKLFLEPKTSILPETGCVIVGAGVVVEVAGAVLVVVGTFVVVVVVVVEGFGGGPQAWIKIFTLLFRIIISYCTL